MKQEKERLCWQGDPWGTPMEMLIRKLCLGEFQSIPMANPAHGGLYTDVVLFFFSFFSKNIGKLVSEASAQERAQSTRKKNKEHL